MTHEQICAAIARAMSQLVENDVWSVGSALPAPHVERPKNTAHGDWTTNVAFVLAKVLGRAPQQIATEIAEALRSHVDGAQVTTVGGYVNIVLTREASAAVLQEVVDAGAAYGTNAVGVGKKVIVEYSSPNIAKPFTIGHFRSTIIGDAMARIMVANGYDVVRDNHLGDWGTQFGKLIVAIKKWGNEEEIAHAEDPVKELVALYVKFHDEAEKDVSLEEGGRTWFTKLEQGDTEARSLWRKCIAWSKVEFDRIYKRLGVTFDTELGESFFEDKMNVVIEDLHAKNLLTQSDGAQLVFFPEDKFPPLMILKSSGATLYATRDLAADRYRKETYRPDIVINEVGAEQSLYFKQLFETEHMLGYFEPEQRVHVAHGLFRFKDGKMSTRKGNVIWLEDVLDRAVTEAQAMGAPEEIAEMVGIGALKFNDLKREASREVLFDWEEILNVKGDSGPYMQYTYARCQSVLRKATETSVTPNAQMPCANAVDIERLIARYPEVVERAAQEYAPHHIAQYMIELARAYNAYYGDHTIIDAASPEVSAYRVLLTHAVAQVMKNALITLGITAPEKM